MEDDGMSEQHSEIIFLKTKAKYIRTTDSVYSIDGNQIKDGLYVCETLIRITIINSDQTQLGNLGSLGVPTLPELKGQGDVES